MITARAMIIVKVYAGVPLKNTNITALRNITVKDTALYNQVCTCPLPGRNLHKMTICGQKDNFYLN